jgi:uncharacterized membrane protein (UPF0136 family)
MRAGRNIESGRFGELGQSAPVHDFPTKVLWVYIILLLAGGLIGFFKAKSKVSLILSVVFAALLAATTLRSVFQPGFARDLANVVLFALVVVFALRLARTRKFMPSGLMLGVTIAALVLRNIFAN